MQLFNFFVIMCFYINVAFSNYTYRATWRVEKVCQIYHYDFKKCHPCDKRFCGPPKLKANINCQIFTCISDLPIPTASTPRPSTSTTTSPTTTTTPTATTTTTPTTTTTTAFAPTSTTSTSQASPTTTTSTENLCIMAT